MNGTLAKAEAKANRQPEMARVDAVKADINSGSSLRGRSERAERDRSRTELNVKSSQEHP